MSKIFPNAYAIFFIVQIVILMVAYMILRFKTKLKVLTTLCLSILVVAGSTLLILRYDMPFRMSYTDQQEYAAGTFVVAAPFILILFIKFFVHITRLLGPLLRANVPRQHLAGSERTRILRMIDEGKITPDEGSDLLEAMGRSNALQGQDRFSRLDMAILCGVALVVMGFFLPWVHIRSSAYQSGHQIGAVGWTVLAIAIVSIIPVFVTPKNLLYKISIFHLFVTLVGLLLVLITLLRAGNHLGIGIIVCAMGFTIELIASGAKFKRLAA